VSAPPKSKDRGPASKEDTQTDFNAMDIFQGAPVPTTGIDACLSDGFALNSGLKVVGSGVMLVAGEAFKWSPWLKVGRKEGTIGGGGMANDNKGAMSEGGKLLNARNQWEVDDHAWGVLDLVWPKPGKTGSRLIRIPKADIDEQTSSYSVQAHGSCQYHQQQGRPSTTLVSDWRCKIRETQLRSSTFLQLKEVFNKSQQLSYQSAGRKARE